MQITNESLQSIQLNQISPWFGKGIENDLTILIRSHQPKKNIDIQQILSNQAKLIPRVYRVFEEQNKIIKWEENHYKSIKIKHSLPSIFIRDILLDGRRQSMRQSLQNQTKYNNLVKDKSNPVKYFAKKQQGKIKENNLILRKKLQTPAVCNRIREIVKSNLKLANKQLKVFNFPRKQIKKVDQSYFIRTKSLDFQYYKDKDKKIAPPIKKITSEKKHIIDSIFQKWW